MAWGTKTCPKVSVSTWFFYPFLRWWLKCVYFWFIELTCLAIYFSHFIMYFNYVLMVSKILPLRSSSVNIIVEVFHIRLPFKVWRICKEIRKWKHWYSRKRRSLYSWLVYYPFECIQCLNGHKIMENFSLFFSLEILEIREKKI